MNLKPMDPQILLKLLEGVPDTLSPAADEREKFYRDQSCPYCQGNSFNRRGDSRTIFHDGDPLPRYSLECTNCGCHFNPFSGIIIHTGNLGKAYQPAVPIINPKD